MEAVLQRAASRYTQRRKRKIAGNAGATTPSSQAGAFTSAADPAAAGGSCRGGSGGSGKGVAGKGRGAGVASKAAVATAVAAARRDCAAARACPLLCGGAVDEELLRLVERDMVERLLQQPQVQGQGRGQQPHQRQQHQRPHKRKKELEGQQGGQQGASESEEEAGLEEDNEGRPGHAAAVGQKRCDSSGGCIYGNGNAWVACVAMYAHSCILMGRGWDLTGRYVCGWGGLPAMSRWQCTVSSGSTVHASAIMGRGLRGRARHRHSACVGGECGCGQCPSCAQGGHCEPGQQWALAWVVHCAWPPIVRAIPVWAPWLPVREACG